MKLIVISTNGDASDPIQRSNEIFIAVVSLIAFPLVTVGIFSTKVHIRKSIQ